MKSMPIDRTSEYVALRIRPTLKKLKDIIEDLRLLAHNKSLWRDIPNFKLAHISEYRCVQLDMRDKLFILLYKLVNVINNDNN